jgi:hypothetical protein
MNNVSEVADLKLPASPVTLAISTRQPWAWAIINAGKDIENRPFIRRFKSVVGQRILIHASSICIQQHFDQARSFINDLGLDCPDLDQLERGGVIGSVRVISLTKASDSRWWVGPGGLVLADPEPLPFRPYRGNTGLFRVAQ